MAELANLNVYDDASTSYVLEPISDSEWMEISTTKSRAAKLHATISSLLLKNKYTRRLYKLDVPVMETVGTLGTVEGYVAPPEVAHTISVSIAVFSNDNRATITDVSHAVKLCVNTFLGDATAGTVSAYRDASNMPRKFLITGVGGD